MALSRRPHPGRGARLIVRYGPTTACVLAGLAVALGALGAHALEDRLSREDLEVYRTAASYQLFHALALLAAVAVDSPRPRLARLAGWLFLTGIVLFSGSLYLIATTEIRTLVVVLATPAGGVSLIGGWGVLAIAFWPVRLRE